MHELLAHIVSSQQPGEHVCWIAVAEFSLRVTHAFFLFGVSGALGEIP